MINLSEQDWTKVHICFISYIELTANKIDRLDLHGCTALDELHMSENLVDYITFYGCTALRYVDIRNNKVKSLDFSANEKMNFLFATANPELTTVFIKEGANYSTIDVDSSVTIIRSQVTISAKWAETGVMVMLTRGRNN